MATLYSQADKNIRLTWIYITGFLVFVIGVGYVFSQAMQSSGILYFALIFSFGMSFGSYWWSDKIVLSISGAKEVKKDNARKIYDIVENLCITSGLPMPKIYVMEDDALNAFATGRDPEHGVICFTTGLLQKLKREEIEGVTAHELSHIQNRDVLLSTVIAVLVGFIALLADFFGRWVFWGGGRRSRGNQNGKAQLIILVVALVLWLLAPIAATLVQLAISRKREFLADANGTLLTRYPEGLASALEKIAADPQLLESANRATAHLFIENPFKGKKVSRLFMTHPPVEERIKALRVGMGK